MVKYTLYEACATMYIHGKYACKFNIKHSNELVITTLAML